MVDSVSSKTFVIAGGSGFLGVSLAHHLAELGGKVIILSRSAPKIAGPWQHVKWDGRRVDSWQEALDGAGGLVNLAGRSVDCIKTPENQDDILRSRVESARALGTAMRQVKSPPPVWVQMSTAHIYGDPRTAVCDEQSAFGYGLAPFVGQAWEEAFNTSLLPSQRGVVLRTSFVLGKDRGAGGGALNTLATLARFGLGGRIGSGKQGMSWLHEHDLNRIFHRSLTHVSMQGTYIATAPNPVAQVDFMRELRRAVGMPIGLPAFSWMVRIGAPLLFSTDPELALFGRYVVPKRLQQEGFEFEFSELNLALQNLLGKNR